MFYKKSKKIKTNVLDFIDSDIKLTMNWNMVKNGASVNEVFKINPVILDSFLKDPKEFKNIANEPKRPKGQLGLQSFKNFI